MYRKPIFDAVRTMLNRGFTQDEVDALDRACDLAEAPVAGAATPSPKPKAADAAKSAPADHILGSVSEEFESGGRGPETVSTGKNDPGGVSYGVYQLASKTGTCAAFVKSEGKAWADKFLSHAPGSEAFSTAWRAIAAAEPDVFRKAQHAFIERTHYRRVCEKVSSRKGLDLDKRGNAVRDATWSCSVQHGGAADILVDAIDRVERDTSRDDPDYDRKLIDAIYKARTDYVLAVANNPKRTPGERAQLISITKNRYPKELQKALKLLDGDGGQVSAAADPASPPAAESKPSASADSIDGNAVAKANGVAVKSAAVKISKLHPKMEAVIVAVAQCAKEMGLPQPVITSGNDSKHMKNSLHYSNRALDFRGNNVKVAVGHKLRDAVAARLGAEYDVAFEVFENWTNNHLHVEYDPD